MYYRCAVKVLILVITVVITLKMFSRYFLFRFSLKTRFTFTTADIVNLFRFRIHPTINGQSVDLLSDVIR